MPLVPAGIARCDGGKFPAAANLLVPAPELLSFSTHDRDFAGCPAGFAAPGTGKLAEPISDCPQPSRKLRQRITAPSHIKEGAAYDAMLAIFAAFKPAAPAMMTGPGLGPLASVPYLRRVRCRPLALRGAPARGGAPARRRVTQEGRQRRRLLELRIAAFNRAGHRAG